MKTLYILFIGLLVAGGVMAQGCLPEGIDFTTQSQVDSFQILHPNCTEIAGNVSICGDDITNLNGLDVLISIRGDLMIGFLNWDSVNPFLINLEGLNNINSISGSLLIIGNTSLTSLSGLNGLTFIGEDLNIGVFGYNWGAWSPLGNPELTNITALSNVSAIGGDILILANNNLSSIAGLESLTTVNGDISFVSNSLLSSLSHLENLTYINGSLALTNNSFIDLEGLDNIDSIGNNFSVQGEDSLLNLNSLEDLIYVGGDLNIVGNEQLSSLTGIDNIESESIIQLGIYNNPSLSHCEVQSICDYLLSPNGSVIIYGNASGCNSPIEVSSACGNSTPCLPFGNYYFFSQSDIDSFQSNYPNCYQLNGLVKINGDDIDNLDGLSSVTMVNGALQIRNNPNLNNITGLSNLHIITGLLHIYGSDYLGSLSGLNSLTYIGEKLIIMKANSLHNLTGLEELSYIGGDLSLRHNESLSSLNGLNKLSHIGGNVEIEYNPNLQDFSGCDALSSIGGAMRIHYMDGLASMDGLHNLSLIGGGVNLYANESLSSLEGLANLNYIGGGLYIRSIHNLTNLTGLENLSSIDGNLEIWQNEKLCDISAISNISAYSIGGLRISWNPLLSECAIQNICEYIGYTPSWDINIEDNASGCNSQEEVEEACESVSVSEYMTQQFLSLYPNPSSTQITIELPTTLNKNTVLTICNLNGQELITRQVTEQLTVIDVSGLPKGVYFLKMMDNEGMMKAGRVLVE